MQSEYPIREFFERDHLRLDSLLAQAFQEDGTVLLPRFEEFRKGLLRHIAQEEKILFPVAILNGGPEARETAALLRLHHEALAALLVLDPTPNSIGALRHILAVHNPLEEGPDTFYALCEGLCESDRKELLEKIKAYPDVPVAARMQTPQLATMVRHALVRAGFPESLLEE